MNSAKRHFTTIDKKGEIVSNGLVKKERQDKKLTYWEYSISGFYFIAPLIIFLIIGLFLDRTFNKKPLFTVFFIFLGLIGSIYNLYRLTKK